MKVFKTKQAFGQVQSISSKLYEKISVQQNFLEKKICLKLFSLTCNSSLLTIVGIYIFGFLEKIVSRVVANLKFSLKGIIARADDESVNKLSLTSLEV